MKPIRCLLGWHDYLWHVTMSNPQYNWKECDRCGAIHPSWKQQYEAYQTRRDPNEDQDENQDTLV